MIIYTKLSKVRLGLAIKITINSVMFVSYYKSPRNNGRIMMMSKVVLDISYFAILAKCSSLEFRYLSESYLTINNN